MIPHWSCAQFGEKSNCRTANHTDDAITEAAVFLSRSGQPVSLSAPAAGSVHWWCSLLARGHSSCPVLRLVQQLFEPNCLAPSPVALPQWPLCLWPPPLWVVLVVVVVVVVVGQKQKDACDSSQFAFITTSEFRPRISFMNPKECRPHPAPFALQPARVHVQLPELRLAPVGVSWLRQVRQHVVVACGSNNSKSIQQVSGGPKRGEFWLSSSWPPHRSHNQSNKSRFVGEW